MQNCVSVTNSFFPVLISFMSNFNCFNTEQDVCLLWHTQYRIMKLKKPLKTKLPTLNLNVSYSLTLSVFIDYKFKLHKYAWH